MPSYYWSLESEEHYRLKWTSPPSYGFNDRFYSKFAKSMCPADMIADYVTGCGFACTMKVLPWDAGKCYECRPDLDLTGGGFPWRVRVELQLQIDEVNQMAKYNELESRLEICGVDPSNPNRQVKNPGWLQGKHLIPISRHDFMIIEEAIRKAL